MCCSKNLVYSGIVLRGTKIEFPVNGLWHSDYLITTQSGGQYKEGMPEGKVCRARAFPVILS